MAAMLQWTEPIAARQWRWQAQELPAIKKCFWLFPKWSLLIGIPVLLFVHHIAPTELPHIVTCLFGLTVLLPAHLGLSTWVICQSSEKYSITEKGLFLAYTSKFLYPWKSVESYSIAKHPHLPDLYVLEFKMKHRCHIYQWSFSASQVSEQELKRAIGKHCPDSRLSVGTALT